MRKYSLVGAGVIGAATIAVAIYILTVAPAPLSTVKTFIASVEANEFEAAYSEFHGDLKLLQSLPEFSEAWKSRTTSLNETNRFWSTVIESDTAEVSGRFTTAGHEDWSAVFQLIKSDGRWQIVDYEVHDGPDSPS